MDRRTFLKGVLATAAAPAIVKAENLMKIVVPEKRIITMLRPTMGQWQCEYYPQYLAYLWNMEMSGMHRDTGELKRFHYSRLVEEHVDSPNMIPTLRRFYEEDAIYSLNKKMQDENCISVLTHSKL